MKEEDKNRLRDVLNCYLIPEKVDKLMDVLKQFWAEAYKEGHANGKATLNDELENDVYTEGYIAGRKETINSCRKMLLAMLESIDDEKTNRE